MAENKEKSLVRYTSRDGQEITLSFEIIKNYLVSGKKDKVTEQEFMYFMAICKSRGLNPFKKDAYLIKYGDDPAAIVTSIDYFRSRARVQKDCIGWRKGIIVKDKDGKVKDSAGLMQDGEILLGGFFEATPANWKDPFRLEVNLKGYIKKTNEGKITKFWSEDNQPSQIAKVAESQGLRTLWPDEFQGLYEETEIKAAESEMASNAGGSYSAVVEPKEPIDTSIFDRHINGKKYKPELLAEFINLSAKTIGKTPDEIKAIAQEDFEDFWKQYMLWAIKQQKKTTPEAAVGERMVHCPNKDKHIAAESCDTCKNRVDCPAWSDFDKIKE